LYANPNPLTKEEATRWKKLTTQHEKQFRDLTQYWETKRMGGHNDDRQKTLEKGSKISTKLEELMSAMEEEHNQYRKL